MRPGLLGPSPSPRLLISSGCPTVSHARNSTIEREKCHPEHAFFPGSPLGPGKRSVFLESPPKIEGGVGTKVLDGESIRLKRDVTQANRP